MNRSPVPEFDNLFFSDQLAPPSFNLCIFHEIEEYRKIFDLTQLSLSMIKTILKINRTYFVKTINEYSKISRYSTMLDPIINRSDLIFDLVETFILNADEVLSLNNESAEYIANYEFLLIRSGEDWYFYDACQLIPKD